VLSWPKLIPTRGPEPDVDPVAAHGGTGPEKGSVAKQELGKGTGKPVNPLLPADPKVLTVAQDGSGQFRTLREALDATGPGMTIRILDSAAYTEVVSLRQASKHAGITLEAPHRASLVTPPNCRAGVAILHVPRVTLRGFRLQPNSQSVACLVVAGSSAGVRLENLNIQGATGPTYGLTLEALELSANDPPVVVQNCTLAGTSEGAAIRVSGLQDYKTGRPCNRVFLYDNRIEGFGTGIIALGAVGQIQIVGNRIWSPKYVGIQLENLMPGAQDLLVANNTLFECPTGFRVWDDAVKGKNIQVRNNLILGAAEPDMVFLDSGGTQQEARAAGNVQSLLKLWQFGHNWREVRIPTGTSFVDKGWIPPGPEDVRQEPIEVLSRNPASPDFLRPAKDSPLASKGAGKEDATLPSYVGALPPDGLAAWDWQKTWDARHPKMLLTVSKDPKDGGEFRSIKEAVNKVVRPNMTVRVLDSATYVEMIAIQNPDTQQGLTLETAHAAMITPPAGAKVGLLIRKVPKVTIRGFRMRADQGVVQGGVYLCGVLGATPGLFLDGLECQTSQFDVGGVEIEGVGLVKDEAPVIVQNCTFFGLTTGLRVLALDTVSKQPQLCRRIVLRQNKAFDCTAGIVLSGLVSDVHVVGNRVWGCINAGIDLKDLYEGSSGILIANNSIQAPFSCLQVEGEFRGVRDVIIRNNLALAEKGPDFAFHGKDKQPLTAWTIDHNWRQVQPPKVGSGEANEWLLSDKDRFVDKIALQSLDPKETGFMRPPKDSPLARAGAGGDLPGYVGAVSPEGVTPWDWEKTWKACIGLEGSSSKK
jgi:hypothetical protein